MSLTFKKSNNVAVLADDLTAAKDFLLKRHESSN